MEISAAKKLSDAELTATLKKAIAAERNSIAASIACLVEITARDLHSRLGASSLFVYLTRDLKLSESSASKRCAAIKAIRKFPEILELIQSGRLHLSNISLVSRHLTPENGARLIALAQTQTQRELEKALALEFPVAAKRDTLRPVIYSSRRNEMPQQVLEKSERSVAEVSESEGPVFSFESQAPQAELGVRVHATLSPEAAAALEFLAGAMPGKSASDILSMAVCELRKGRDLATAKPRGTSRGKPKGEVASPTNSNAPKISRYIPVALRRAVAQRDGHRCSYVAPENSEVKRCEAVHRLEFDHVTPRAFGGQNTLGNLRLLCGVAPVKPDSLASGY